jgi:hypothetical protein
MARSASARIRREADSTSAQPDAAGQQQQRGDGRHAAQPGFHHLAAGDAETGIERQVADARIAIDAREAVGLGRRDVGARRRQRDGPAHRRIRRQLQGGVAGGAA